LGSGDKTSLYFTRLVELDCLPGILCVLSGSNVHSWCFDVPLLIYLVLAKSDWQVHLCLIIGLLHRRCKNQVLAHAICCSSGIRAVARARAAISGCSCGGGEELSLGATLYFVLS